MHSRPTAPARNMLFCSGIAPLQQVLTATAKPSSTKCGRRCSAIACAIRSSIHARSPTAPSAPPGQSSTYAGWSFRTSALPRASGAASSSRSTSVSVTRHFFIALGGGLERYCLRPAHAPNSSHAANLRLLRYRYYGTRRPQAAPPAPAAARHRVRLNHVATSRRDALPCHTNQKSYYLTDEITLLLCVRRK